MAGSRIHVGTSGYVYRDWRGVFYPPDLPARLWLDHYSKAFSTLEINNTFYRLPSLEAARHWGQTVPRDFVFVAKGSRYLTHMKRLKDTGPGLRRFFGRVRGMAEKLAVILWQLPPTMSKADPGRLDAFLQAQPKDYRHAVEFRAPAWYTEDVCRVLERHGAAFCEHDLLSVRPPRLTGGWRYLRFHGKTAKYRGRYGRRSLAPFAKDLKSSGKRDGDCFVYFNNDFGGAAVFDARDLMEELGLDVAPALARLPGEPR